MYQVFMRSFQYVVVDGQGAPCAGPYAFRDDAQLAANRLIRDSRYW